MVHSVAMSALLCHEEIAQGTQGALWHKSAGEEILQIKPQHRLEKVD